MIEGERVVLRAVEREDLDVLWELSNDLELVHLVSDQPPLPGSRDAFEAEYDQEIDEPDPSRERFAIEADGEVIGECNLHGIDRYIQVCEIGIWLGRDYWGQGYGQDAVRTLLGYAFRYLNLRRVWLEVMADDARAVGAYRAAGFIDEGRLRAHAWHDGGYKDVLLMGILREEWQRRSR